MSGTDDSTRTYARRLISLRFKVVSRKTISKSTSELSRTLRRLQRSRQMRFYFQTHYFCGTDNILIIDHWSSTARADLIHTCMWSSVNNFESHSAPKINTLRLYIYLRTQHPATIVSQPDTVGCDVKRFVNFLKNAHVRIFGRAGLFALVLRGNYQRPNNPIQYQKYQRQIEKMLNVL